MPNIAGGEQMRFWIDEKTGCNMCEPDCCDEWLEFIWEIGVDYDGCNTVKSLRELVDELLEMNQKARDCLREGRLFPENVENPAEKGEKT